MAHRQTVNSHLASGADLSIKSVRVLQCGRAEQHQEHRYGSRLPQLWWVFFGRRWVPLPLQCFLIDHRDGFVLFDTGVDPAIQSDRGFIKQAIGRFLLPRIFRLHLNEADRIHDVAGDGSIILLPTPGHTPGSLSMLIRQDGWDPILLVGDLTYETSLLALDIIPGTGDRETLLASFAKVRRLKKRLPSLLVVASHDFASAESVSRATHQEIAPKKETDT